MAEIDVTQLSPPDAYKILIGSVVPRPVAWVSTVSPAGVNNLAPFSFFTAVCSNPPTVLFCPVTPQDLKVKDTLQNIRDTGVFVVNVATEALVEKMNQTSAPYAPDVSEFAAVGVTPAASRVVQAPRVAESPVSLECRLTQIVPVGDGTPGSGHVVIGQVVFAHIDDAVLDGGRILTDRLQPVSRLAGTDYAPVREIFALPRPTTA
jgi:flavin reductase (DIM6/NTAB) family NADH-FMN oxidoreductase RutF